MTEENKKKRGRPHGTTKKDPKAELRINMTATTYEPKKRGRKPKTETVTVAFVAEVPLDGEIEGTISDKLKNLAEQIKYMDWLLDKEPYRVDLRLKKNETIQRMCFLIKELN
jgi:hypothetical protein